jgi:putative OPT family oligopeptide transporter
MSQAPQQGPAAAAMTSVEPYIAAETVMPEMTLRALVVGSVLGIIFGASSLYLVLKVGLTVSASIPVAVIAIALFRMGSKLGIKDSTILENNIMQTAGSAGESIAFGVGVTMPAIMILGFDLEITRVMMVSILGGLLGILMMIPLRRALIVQQHGLLKYPEGTACAEVLKAGASAESQLMASPAAKAEAAAGPGQKLNAQTIFTGFGIGLAYKAAMVAFKGWRDVPERVFGKPLESGSISAEISPELLGVGYIIGPQIASIMCAGGVLAYLLLIPMIKFFGAGMTGPLAPGTIPIADMSPDEIRGAYILYIGAGAVAAGGIVSLLRSMPTIWHGIKEGMRDFGPAKATAGVAKRTDNDLSMKLVLIGSIVLLAMIALAPGLHVGLLGAILIIIFGFLFVTVSSRLTGEIGSSSNPISGMTVATLLFTSLIFLALGWTGGTAYVTALSVGAIVCIAASNGGTTSQDLKTGYLVGATPRLQQIAILIGSLGSALILGPILLKLNDSATVYVPIAEVAPAGLHAPADAHLGDPAPLIGPQARTDAGTYRSWHKTDDVGAPQGRYLIDGSGAAVYLADPGINGTHKTRPDGSPVTKFDAPKATLMSYIIKGILDRQLPWGLVLFGVMIALVLEMSGIPSLAFAVGVYLPLSSSSPIFIGGMVRWLVDLRARKKLLTYNLTEEQIAAEGDKSPGVLMASGYIAGGAIAGILIAFMAGAFDEVDNSLTTWARAHNPFFGDLGAPGWWPWPAAWGPNGLSLIPFALLVALLYLAGREKILAGKQRA